MKLTNACPPMPEDGWSREKIVLENAIVAPPQVSRPRTPSGVWCDGDVAEAAMWRHDDRRSLALPEKPKAKSVIKGKYLFGGMYYKEFGHFITETISRLWANDNSYDGIIMTPKHTHLTDFPKWQKEFLKAINIKEIPILVSEPVIVEHLTVPGQGFGLGSISKSTPEFKRLIKSTIGCILPEGTDNIYISRTKNNARGGILAESILENNLRNSGYRIIYAEKMPWQEQVSIYRAAKKIISLDSSALHMVGLVAKPNTDIAVIVRRNNYEWHCMRAQLESFIEKPPLIINSLTAEYLAAGKKSNHQSWGEIDFIDVQDRLIESGFIDVNAFWEMPTKKVLTDDLKEAQRRDTRGPLVYTPVIERII